MTDYSYMTARGVAGLAMLHVEPYLQQADYVRAIREGEAFICTFCAGFGVGHLEKNAVIAFFGMARPAPGFRRGDYERALDRSM